MGRTGKGCCQPGDTIYIKCIKQNGEETAVKCGVVRGSEFHQESLDRGLTDVYRLYQRGVFREIEGTYAIYEG